MFNMKYLEV